MFLMQDKSVAFKIFELGLKKWSSNVDFVLAYLDYLSHLNEDNNTRLNPRKKRFHRHLKTVLRIRMTTYAGLH